MKITWYGTASIGVEHGAGQVQDALVQVSQAQPAAAQVQDALAQRTDWLLFDPFMQFPLHKNPGRAAAPESAAVSSENVGSSGTAVSETAVSSETAAEPEETFFPYKNKFLSASHIFITHGHLDHIYHIPALYTTKDDANIYCTKTPAKTLTKNGLPAEKIIEIAPGFTKDVAGFSVQAFAGKHCKFDAGLIFGLLKSKRFWRNFKRAAWLLGLDKKFPEAGEILFYEIREMMNENAGSSPKRLQILGSMNLRFDEAYPTGADALILPLQGRSDQDTYALKIVERLRPKRIFIDHYDDAFPPLTDNVDVSGFIKNVTEIYHIPCQALKVGERVEI